jgi:integrase/recombinase XerD
MINLDDFQKWLSINYSPKTANDYLAKLETFFKQHEEFNQENINTFLAKYVNTWKHGTFNCYIKAFKQYCKYKNINLDIPKLKETEVQPRKWLKEKEIEEILFKIPVIFRNGIKTQTILTFLFYTGLRPSEVLKLKRENIDLENRLVLIKNTKTSFVRKIVLSSELIKMIKIIFSQEPEITNAFNLKKTYFQYTFNKINKALNINIYPYMARHSYAKLQLKHTNNDLDLLAKSLGHQNVKTTMIYSNIDEEEYINRMKKWLK